MSTNNENYNTESSNNENFKAVNGKPSKLSLAYSKLIAGRAAQKATEPEESPSKLKNGAAPHLDGASDGEPAAAKDNPAAEPSPQAAPISIPFTLIENTAPNKVFCKSYFYNSAGEIEKKVGAQIYSGIVHCHEVSTLEAGIAELQRIKTGKLHNFAAVWGKVNAAKAGDHFPLGLAGKCLNGAIPRSNSDFGWNTGPAVLPVDFDPFGTRAFDWRELDDIYCLILPQLKVVKRCFFPSNSSFIRTRDGTFLKNPGFRMYVAVDDGTRIEDLLTLLFQGSWAHGGGHIKISDNGRPRVCGLVDLYMARPIQPDFVAPAKLGEGLVYDYPEEFPQWRGTEPLLITEGIEKPIDLKAWGKGTKVKDELKKAEPKCAEQKDWYIENKALPRLRAKFPGRPDEALRGLARKQLETRNEQLDPDWPIHLSETEVKTVREIWTDPSYEDRMCCDPLEPDHHAL